MSHNSDDSSELSSILRNDSSGRKLARYLMKKDGVQRTHRLFDERRVRRLSVQVEILKPADIAKATGNNNENCNSENIALEMQSALPQEQSALRSGNNKTPSTPPSETAKRQSSLPQEKNIPNMSPTRSNNLCNLAKSPIHAAPKTPEAFRLGVPSTTPKSSQISARRSPPEDRLRRLTFKHLQGAGSRRKLLDELNFSENVTPFSDFEQNMPECTSTPAVGSSQHNLANVKAALHETRREFSLQKGSRPGQIVLTPSHITARQSLSSRPSNNSVVRCEDPIEEVTIQNGVTYGPRNSSKRLTNHNAISMIITDDESEDEIDTNRPPDKEPANVDDCVPRGNEVRDGTFARPCTSIFKKSIVPRPIDLFVTMPKPAFELPESSSSRPDDDAAENADDENSTRPSILPLPLRIQTRIETEFSDEPGDLQQVSFHRQEHEARNSSRACKQQQLKKRGTPDHVKVYKNAIKKFKPKRKNVYLNGTKRLLYSRNDTTIDRSFSNNEVTSRNAANTAARNSEPELNTNATSIGHQKESYKSPKNRRTSAQRAWSQDNANQKSTKTANTQPTQRIGLSLCKPKNAQRLRNRLRSSSSSSDSEQSSGRERSISLESSFASTRDQENGQSNQRRSRSCSKRKTIQRSSTRLRSKSPILSNRQSPSTSPVLLSPTKRQSSRKESQAREATPKGVTNEITEETTNISRGSSDEEVAPTRKAPRSNGQVREASPQKETKRKRPNVKNIKRAASQPGGSTDEVRSSTRTTARIKKRARQASPQAANQQKTSTPTPESMPNAAEHKQLKNKSSKTAANHEENSTGDDTARKASPKVANQQKTNYPEDSTDEGRSPIRKSRRKTSAQNTTIQKLTKEADTQNTQQHSRSRSKRTTVKKLTTREQSQSSASSEGRSAMQHQSASRAHSRSPSLPLSTIISLPPEESEHSSDEDENTLLVRRPNHSPTSNNEQQQSSALSPRSMNEASSSTAALPKAQLHKPKKRPKSKYDMKKVDNKYFIRPKPETYPDDGIRRSQREHKPVQMHPYAVKIYTRCYHPDEYAALQAKKKSSTNQANNRKTEKPKGGESKSQPLVKKQRMQANAGLTDNNGDNEEIVETMPIGINDWLKSSNVCNSNATHHETNAFLYTLSRELLVSEQHKDIEFRYYIQNSGHQNSNLGYMIFKPKAVKKLVTLKHSDMKFLCIYGQFKFKIQAKNTEMREHHCEVGDAFELSVGDRYSIENLSETTNGQIVLLKENIIQSTN